MDRIRIVGGQRLNGSIPISGAKNATLPLMIAGLLTEDTLILDNAPRLADVELLQRILGFVRSRRFCLPMNGNLGMTLSRTPEY